MPIECSQFEIFARNNVVKHQQTCVRISILNVVDGWTGKPLCLARSLAPNHVSRKAAEDVQKGALHSGTLAAETDRIGAYNSQS